MAISPNSADTIATHRRGNGPRWIGLAARFAMLSIASATMAVGMARAQADASPVVTAPQEAEWRQLSERAVEAQGRGARADAVEFGERALRLAESHFGREHPNTLLSVTNLAIFYEDQGRYAEAEPLYARALEARERLLGREHPDTLASVNDLGTLYYLQRRYAEAHPLFARALEARERLLGRDHPDTLRTLHLQAGVFQNQGHYSAAELFIERALEARERLLGREHPDTLASVNALAALFYAQGRYAEEHPLLARVLEARERVLGREHPDTLQTLNDLATSYSGQGRFAEAEPLRARALEARERLLGREHPDTLDSVESLANLYFRQGRFTEIEPLLTRVLEARERVLGREHPETLDSLNALAALYYAQDRYTEAQPLAARALQTRERVLGPVHRDTIESVRTLAELYYRQRRFTEAGPLLIRALDGMERHLGGDHPATLMTYHNLAALYYEQGRYAEAEPLLARVLEAQERVLGREHPDTARSALHLAEVRLSSPAIASSAIEPARLAVASRRLRFASGEGGYADAQRSREQARLSNHFVMLADAAWTASNARPGERTGLTGEAFSALQDAVAGTTSRAVIQTAVQRFADQTGSNIGALVRERESLGSQWSVNSQAYAGALTASGTDAEGLRQRIHAEREAIEARITEVDTVLRRDFPQYFGLVRPEALDVAAAQAMLAPDEAILTVVPTQFGTHVMAVSRTGIQWARSEWTHERVDEAVGILLRDIAVTMADEDYVYDRRTAHALYRQLVDPVAPILAGKRHVFIAAAGSLTGMPFGILVTEEPQGADDDPRALRTTRWFADAHALINIPSIQSLQFLRRFGVGARPAADPAADFVGFGDPLLQGQAVVRGRGRGAVSLASVFTGRQTRSGGALADISQIRLLARLPGTAVELENMRSALRAPAASLFLAGRATENALRTMDLSGTRVLVLATHGLVAGEVRGASEPGLVFTPPDIATEQDDGFLTASEVTALRLDADWVILSACNTAAGDGSQGAPGLSGLARAFFYAGARNLLASHWPVVDEAAPRLTVRTIEMMRENPALSRAEALQRSMREIRENADPVHHGWAHPGVWAPFSLIGDGAR